MLPVIPEMRIEFVLNREGSQDRLQILRDYHKKDSERPLDSTNNKLQIVFDSKGPQPLSGLVACAQIAQDSEPQSQNSSLFPPGGMLKLRT